MAITRYRCFKCGDNLEPVQFYSLKNGVTERMPICRACAAELFAEYVKKYGNVYDALYHFCAAFNILYNKTLANGITSSALEKDADASKVVKMYMQAILLPQYNGKGFLDSDLITATSLEEDAETKAMINASKVAVNKWGAGYSKEEYVRLNELYSQWASGTPQDTVTQISLTKDLCKIDLKIEQAAVKNLDTKDLLKQKQDLIKSLAIDPQTLLKNRKDNEATECFGAWIAEIEKTSPAEYLDDPTVYFDVNGIEDYWNKHVKRPLKNLLLGTKDFPDINLGGD